MRTTLIVLLGCVALTITGTAAAKEPPKEEAKAAGSGADGKFLIPELPSAGMYVSWKDFKELLGLIQARQPEQKPAPKPEPKPPAPYTLLSADYRAELVSPGSIQIDAAVRLQVWAEEWTQVPLVGDSVALTTAVVDGKESFLHRREPWFELLNREPGAHEIQLRFYVPATDNEGVVTFKVPCATTSTTRMTLFPKTAGVVVSSPVAVNIASRAEGDEPEFDLVFRPTDEIEVNWRLPAQEPKVEEPPPPPPPPALATFIRTLCDVSDQFLLLRSEVQYDVLRGETQQFGLTLPVTASITRVEGEGLEWKDREEGEIRFIDVHLNHTVDTNYAFVIEYEALLPGQSATMPVPALRTLDVTRQTGHLAVTASGAVRVDTGDSTQGLRRIDTRETPAPLRAVAAHPILHAFEFTQPEYLLPLAIQRLDQVEVRVASIDSGQVTTVVTDKGLALTQATYEVRNNHLQFLRIDPGPDAEVWDAEVNGNPVRPAKEESGSGVLIPLLRSAETGRAGGAFPVSLTYLRHVNTPAGLNAETVFSAPAVDMFVNEFSWSVFLPESRRVYQMAGDLKPVSGVIQGPIAALTDVSQAQRRPVAAQRETVYRLRQGIERFYVQDINGPGEAAPGGATPAATPAPPRAGAEYRIAGVLPIASEIPKVGIPICGATTLVEKGRVLSMTLRTCNTSLLVMLRCLLYGLLCLAGLFAGRLIKRIPDRRVALVLGAALLFVCALVWRAYFRVPGVGVVAGIVAWGITGLVLGALRTLRRGAMAAE